MAHSGFIAGSIETGTMSHLFLYYKLTAHSGFIAGSIETTIERKIIGPIIAHSGFIAGSIETDVRVFCGKS